MGAFRSLFRAVSVSYAMGREREKMKAMVALIDDHAAKLYATVEASYAPLAAFKDIHDAAERVAREPKVISASAAVAALGTRICNALCEVDADHQLQLAAASVKPILDDLGKALNGAYLRVLMLDPGPVPPPPAPQWKAALQVPR
jgi:hypothetical protein